MRTASMLNRIAASSNPRGDQERGQGADDGDRTGERVIDVSSGQSSAARNRTRPVSAVARASSGRQQIAPSPVAQADARVASGPRRASVSGAGPPVSLATRPQLQVSEFAIHGTAPGRPRPPPGPQGVAAAFSAYGSVLRDPADGLGRPADRARLHSAAPSWQQQVQQQAQLGQYAHAGFAAQPHVQVQVLGSDHGGTGDAAGRVLSSRLGRAVGGHRLARAPAEVKAGGEEGAADEGAVDSGDSPAPAPEADVELYTHAGRALVARRSAEAQAASPERVTLDHRGLAQCPLLEGEPRLRLLSLQGNRLTRVSNLHALPNLIFLDLYNNNVSTLSGLEAAPGLRVLMLGRNALTSLAGLSPLRRLDVLDLHDNQLTSTEGLDGLRELRVLNLSGNRLTALSHLRGLTSLKELNVRRNAISHTRQLAALPQLERLFLSHNRIASFEDVPAVFRLPRLRELALDGTPLAEQHTTAAYRIAVVARAPELTVLDLAQVGEEEEEEAQRARRQHGVDVDLVAVDERVRAISAAADEWNQRASRQPPSAPPSPSKGERGGSGFGDRDSGDTGKGNSDKGGDVGSDSDSGSSSSSDDSDSGSDAAAGARGAPEAWTSTRTRSAEGGAGPQKPALHPGKRRALAKASAQPSPSPVATAGASAGSPRSQRPPHHRAGVLRRTRSLSEEGEGELAPSAGGLAAQKARCRSPPSAGRAWSAQGRRERAGSQYYELLTEQEAAGIEVALDRVARNRSPPHPGRGDASSSVDGSVASPTFPARATEPGAVTGAAAEASAGDAGSVAASDAWGSVDSVRLSPRAEGAPPTPAVESDSGAAAPHDASPPSPPAYGEGADRVPAADTHDRGVEPDSARVEGGGGETAAASSSLPLSRRRLKLAPTGGKRLHLFGAAFDALDTAKVQEQATHVVLQYVSAQEVCAVAGRLRQLRRLKRITLRANGLESLAHITPLHLLSGVCGDLVIEENPVCDVPCLRLYVAHRIPALHTFNGEAVTQWERDEGARIFASCDRLLARAARRRSPAPTAGDAALGSESAEADAAQQATREAKEAVNGVLAHARGVVSKIAVLNNEWPRLVTDAVTRVTRDGDALLRG